MPPSPQHNESATGQKRFTAFRTWLLPAVLGLLTTIAGLVAVAVIDYRETVRFRAEVTARTVEQVSAIRGRTENAINKRLHLTLGLQSYVSVNPDVTDQEFAAYAASLRGQADGIRSVTLIENDIISAVYPLEKNRGALGINLMQDPEQRDAVIRAKQTGTSWLAGPVKLHQGGEAFIHRAPVVVDRKDGGKRYWGLVSILIDKERLLGEIRREIPDSLEVAIRGTDGMGAAGGYILGDDTIKALHPVHQSVLLPSGEWMIIAAPAGGWPASAPVSRMLWLYGGLLACFAGGLML